jgi:hypothetical protein
MDPHPEPLAQHIPDDCEEVNPMGEAEPVPAALGQNSSSSKRMKVTSKGGDKHMEVDQQAHEQGKGRQEQGGEHPQVEVESWKKKVDSEMPASMSGLGPERQQKSQPSQSSQETEQMPSEGPGEQGKEEEEQEEQHKKQKEMQWQEELDYGVEDNQPEEQVEEVREKPQEKEEEDQPEEQVEEVGEKPQEKEEEDQEQVEEVGEKPQEKEEEDQPEEQVEEVGEKPQEKEEEDQEQVEEVGEKPQEKEEEDQLEEQVEEEVENPQVEVDEDILADRIEHMKQHAHAKSMRGDSCQQKRIASFDMLQGGSWQQAFDHLSLEENHWEASAEAHPALYPTCAGWTVLQRQVIKCLLPRPPLQHVKACDAFLLARVTPHRFGMGMLLHMFYPVCQDVFVHLHLWILHLLLHLLL